jgi:hypothetical protein
MKSSTSSPSIIDYFTASASTLEKSSSPHRDSGGECVTIDRDSRQFGSEQRRSITVNPSRREDVHLAQAPGKEFGLMRRAPGAGATQRLLTAAWFGSWSDDRYAK